MAGPGADPRWSPYPVQDWTSLPYDPLAPDHRYVDPRWSPPTSSRHGESRSERGPLLVVLLVLALVAGGMYAADRGSEPVETPTGHYVPADGAVSYLDRAVTRGGQTVRATYVTESARQSGTAALLSLDEGLIRAVYSALAGESPTGQQFWRTTTTQVNSLDGAQQVRLHRVGASVELLAESGPERSRTYRPALVELPPQAQPGRSWSSTGTSGDLNYHSEFGAEAGGGGCLRVSGTITLSDATGAVAEQRRQVTSWCPDAGPVLVDESSAERRTSEQQVAAPGPPAGLKTVSDPLLWEDPAGWRARGYDAMSIDPTFGEGTMAGAPGNAPAVLTDSGLMIRSSLGDDLVAFTPKTRTQWTSVWRMRPGGRVLSVAAFGDVVLATTSQRRLVAYTAAGIRLWSRDLSDVAFQPPVAVDASAVVLVDAAGRVSVLDIATGLPRWDVEVGAEVTAAPVVGGDAVVIIDGAGLVHAYAAADGTPRWSITTTNDGVRRGCVVDDELLLHNGSTLMALDLSDGRNRWWRPTQGTVDELRPFGDRIVLATRRGTTVYDRTGAVLSRWPAYAAMTVNGDHLIGWGESEAEVRRSDLGLAATWDTPDQTSASAAIQAVAARQGVYRFTTGWQMIEFGDQP